MEGRGQEIVCKNTYKNENAEQRREAFTRKWAELISRKEKTKLAVGEFDNEPAL